MAMPVDDPHEDVPSTIARFRHIGARRALAAAAARGYASKVFLGLVVDLERTPPAVSEPGIAMVARDSRRFRGFHDALGGAGPDEAPDLIARIRLCGVGVRTLYAAEAPDGSPLYAQWLVSSGEQAAARTALRGFPPLGEGESLVEGAYTFPAARGRGAMRDGMAQLIEIARRRGDRRVLTYVHHDNVPSLRGCRAVGFHLDHVRVDRWRAGKVRTAYVPAGRADRARWDALGHR